MLLITCRMLDTLPGAPARRSFPQHAPTLSGKAAAIAWARKIINDDIVGARYELEGIIRKIAKLTAQSAQSPQQFAAKGLGEQLTAYEGAEVTAAGVLQALFQNQQGLDGDDVAIEKSIHTIVLREAIKKNTAIGVELKKSLTGAGFDLSHCGSTEVIVALLLPAISARLTDTMRDGMEINLSQVHPFQGILEEIIKAINLGLLPNNDETRAGATKLQARLNNLLRTPVQKILHHDQTH